MSSEAILERHASIQEGEEVTFYLDGVDMHGVLVKRRGRLAQIKYAKGSVQETVWTDKYQLQARAAGTGPSATRGGGGGDDGGASLKSTRSSCDLQAMIDLSEAPYMNCALSIVVVGASGDLAKKKTYPALLDLFSHGHLPMEVRVVGVARSALDDGALRTRLRPFLAQLPHAEPDLLEAFLQRCTYRQMASYADAGAMGALDAELREDEARHPSGVANRLFYFAIPPNVFLDTAATIRASAVSPTPGFTRLIVEKPFGHDHTSALALAKSLAAVFPEEQVYRIDHYLGKEMVQNLLVLRFGNVLFRGLWDRHSVKSVQITFKEDFGTMGRGGYFDSYGIIRDVLQNHLMQVLALVAMEEPASVYGPDAGTAIRDAKVAVMKKIRPISMEDVVVGQYEGDAQGKEPGYLDDATVPNDSRTPTFATVCLYIDNERWAGVPFILRAGKALDERKAEVRVQMVDVAGAGPTFGGRAVPRNELVVRLQPDEAIYLKANMKAPGLSTDPQQVELDLSYKERFYTGTTEAEAGGGGGGGGGIYSPDAYTRLLLETLLGRQAQFVRADELLESWKIWDPVLAAVEQGGGGGEGGGGSEAPQAVVPMHKYAYGSRGPPQSDALVARKGYVRNKDYVWRPSRGCGKV